MHISIRAKLLMYMTVSSILFAVLLFGFNTFFGEKYYIYSKKSLLIKSSKEISKLIEKRDTAEEFKDKELIYAIRTLEKSIGGTVFIGTEEGELYYPIEGEHGILPGAGFVPRGILSQERNAVRPPISSFNFLDFPRHGLKDWQQYDEKSIFFITKDPSFNIDTLRFQTHMDNNLFLLVWVPMAGIAENAAISNKFTAIIGLITVFIIGIWTLLISNRFTKPITEMNKITKKMSNLDFSETLNIKSKDELGELSRSINQLSENLDHAINELSRKNEQLEKEIVKERELDKMRREFVSNVSHELKTPIFLIQGYAEGLKTNVAEDEARRDFYCDVIMEETEKMDSLIKDLLDLSQIESGMFKIQKTSFNLSLLTETVLSKYEDVLEEKEFHLTAEIEKDIIADADAVRTEQVMVNYINNAINYADDKKLIKVTLKPSEEIIRLSVYNSGNQIPHEDLDKIWTSFYKVNRARTRDFGGTGLGLSIVRAIQEAHQNRYGVINLNDGVVFWAEFSRMLNR